jgi:hypothetical protein
MNGNQRLSRAAQSLLDNLPLVTNDAALIAFGVAVVW